MKTSRNLVVSKVLRIIRVLSPGFFAALLLVFVAACTPPPAVTLSEENDADQNDADQNDDAGQREDAGQNDDTGSQDDVGSEVCVDDCDDANDAEPTPQINLLSVNGEEANIEIYSGDDVEVAWDASDVDTCQALGTFPGWSGAKNASGQQFLSTDPQLAEGNYSLELRCEAQAETTSLVRTVTIVSSEPCADRKPPHGWARLGEPGTISCYYDYGWKVRDCTRWNGGISHVPFYEENGLSHRLAFAGRPDAKQFLAIELDTTGMSPLADGRLQNSSSDPFAPSASAIATISSCPGDFHQQAVMNDTGCYGGLGAFSAPFRWGGTQTTMSCQLDSGTTYYLNIAPTTSASGTHPDNFTVHPNCEDGPCGRVITWN